MIRPRLPPDSVSHSTMRAGAGGMPYDGWMQSPRLVFVDTPKSLPPPPPLGRVVTLDLAFAAKDRFETATRPFIQELGLRLAKWIDHHPHPAWAEYEGDPRFLLVDKTTAPACPELVTPELIREIGEVHHVFAHGDFDGVISAAKFLRGGEPPYPEADADGRAIDAPGRGFVATERGLLLADAIEWSRDAKPKGHQRFLHALADALISGKEPPSLSDQIAALARAARARREELAPLFAEAVRDHPQILVLRLDRMISPSDKKHLLIRMEHEATIAAIEEPQSLTVATFDESLRLNELELLHGTEGFAWGKARYDEVRPDLVGLLEGR